MALPDDFPIAVKDKSYLRRFGRVLDIDGLSSDTAVAFQGNLDGRSGRCIWVLKTYRAYRRAWEKAADSQLVDGLAEFGAGFDVDHLFPRSWAEEAELNTWWLRLWPVFQEVNRSAGAGREKSALHAGSVARPKGGVIYADELQWMKIIGHPVGTAANREFL